VAARALNKRGLIERVEVPSATHAVADTRAQP